MNHYQLMQLARKLNNPTVEDNKDSGNLDADRYIAYKNRKLSSINGNEDLSQYIIIHPKRGN